MLTGRDIVDRITDDMVDREPETIAAWIDEALVQTQRRAFERAAVEARYQACFLAEAAIRALRPE